MDTGNNLAKINNANDKFFETQGCVENAKKTKLLIPQKLSKRVNARWLAWFGNKACFPTM